MHCHRRRHSKGHVVNVLYTVCFSSSHCISLHWQRQAQGSGGQHGQKATQTLYFLKQLKRAGLTSDHLFHYYSMVIWPVLKYCVPVWHYASSKAQTEQLESVQKRTVHIILNFSSHPQLCYLQQIWLHPQIAERKCLGIFSRHFWAYFLPASPAPWTNRTRDYFKAQDSWEMSSSQDYSYQMPLLFQQYALNH